MNIYELYCLVKDLVKNKHRSIQFQDEGINLGTPGTVDKVNFVGENVTATRLGNTIKVEITGSTSNIPRPLIGIDSENSKLIISFPDTGFDFTKDNPELFLFRYKNVKHSKHGDKRRKKKAGFVHPSTHDASTKWAGWKFFNGHHFYKGNNGISDTVIEGRITEWPIPSTILPYQNIEIAFNIPMFWNKRNIGTTVVSPSVEFDIDPFANNFTTDTHAIGDEDSRFVAQIGSSHQRTKDGIGNNYPNIVRYALAVAVDNPLATKTNGLCPKIFGPLSEEFFTVANSRSAPEKLILTKLYTGNHTHVRTSVNNSPM